MQEANTWLAQEHTVSMWLAWNWSQVLSGSRPMLFPYNHTAYPETPIFGLLWPSPGSAQMLSKIKDPCVTRQLKSWKESSPKPEELPKCIVWVQPQGMVIRSRLWRKIMKTRHQHSGTLPAKAHSAAVPKGPGAKTDMEGAGWSL